MVRISVSFIVFASFLSTALTIMNAFFLKKQFYPSVVYLTKSSTSMAVLYFQAAVVSYLIFSLLRWIFFGQLRAAEIEHAQERVWHAIMETCLAFTVFRDDFSPKFVIQFVVLFFIKAFHWLAEDRVDYMERSPVITLTFHARILGIISLLSAIDSYFISHAFFTTLMRGASAQIVFGFEYAVLLTMIAHVTINYILHLHDLRSPHPWENKAVYMLYAELLTSFLRCILYLAFAVVMMKIHTFPLFAIRPFYLTVRAFRKAVNDVILSRRAINAMNNLFPLATEQDLAESDNTCIICREEMTVQSGAKKLPCNHIFHPNCLRSWFQRQQTCPTCRTDVLAAHRRPTMIPGQAAPMQQQAQQNPFQIPQIPANLFHPFQLQFHLQQRVPGQAAAMMVQPGQQPLQFMGPPFAGFPFGIPPHLLQQQALQQQAQQQALQQQQAQQQNPQQPQTTTQTAQANGTIPRTENGIQANGQTPPGQSETTPSSTSTSDNQQQQQPTANPVNPSNGNNGQQTPGHQQQMPTAATPFFMPMPAFPPPMFGFMPPPPPPLPFPQPPTISGLSDAEITEMEGTERRAVEARIQALRNIQVLLDAAMLQFQQYLTASSQAGPSAWTNNNSADQPSTSSAGTSAEVNQPAQTGTSTLTTNIAPPATT